MAEETAVYRDEVEQVRRRWAEWRRSAGDAMRARPPEELWAAAVELVHRDGIDVTARALDVDKPSLRKWTDRLQPKRQPRPRRLPQKRGNALPAFVELLASGSGMGTSCLVEVESPRGAKLRLELKGMRASELAELIRAFAAA